MRPTLGGSPTAMIRSRAVRLFDREDLVRILLALFSSVRSADRGNVRRLLPQDVPDGTPSAYSCTVTEPITSETDFPQIACKRGRRLVDSSTSAEQGEATHPGVRIPAQARRRRATSEYGGLPRPRQLDLAGNSTGAKLTVAYVPATPAKVTPSLPAVACTEIVMGSTASTRPDHSGGSGLSMQPTKDTSGSLRSGRPVTPTCLVGMLESRRRPPAHPHH